MSIIMSKGLKLLLDCNGKLLDNWITGYAFESGGRTYMIPENGLEEEENAHPIFCEVVLGTVCMCTGKKSADNEMLYENDIIRAETSDECLGVIQFGSYGERHYGFYIHWLTDVAKYYREDFDFWAYNREIKCIGNLYGKIPGGLDADIAFRISKLRDKHKRE